MDAPPENTTAVLAALSELAAAFPDGVVRIERHGPARRRVLAHIDAVLGYGWQAWDPTRSGAAAGVAVDGTTLTNGLVTVVVDPADGPFRGAWPSSANRRRRRGRHLRLVTPPHQGVRDHAETVSVSVAEAGPCGARSVRRRYRLPITSRKAGW